MQINVQFKGLNEVAAGLKDFSERRLRAVAATALTRTAKAVAGDWQKQINAKIDRPMAPTQKAVRIEPANANTLSAKVALKDAGGVGLAPGQYLAQHEYGGGRLVKKFEQALIASGAMPHGYITVPGRGAALNGYGNVSRATIIAVIAQLGKDFSPGYQRTISKSAVKRAATQAKRGKRYLVMPVGHPTVSAGIYERDAGRMLRAVFLFKQVVRYSRKLTLQASAKDVVPAIAAAEFERALAASIARLSARGRV